MKCADLLQQDFEATEAALQHPFLQACSNGSIKPSQFNTWLQQDFIFVNTFARFADSVRGAAPPSHARAYIDGAAGLADELAWFKVNRLCSSGSALLCRGQSLVASPRVNECWALSKYIPRPALNRTFWLESPLRMLEHPPNSPCTARWIVLVGRVSGSYKQQQQSKLSEQLPDDFHKFHEGETQGEGAFTRQGPPACNLRRIHRSAGAAGEAELCGAGCRLLAGRVCLQQGTPANLSC